MMRLAAKIPLALALSSLLVLSSGHQIEERGSAPTLRGTRQLQDQTCSNGLAGFDGFNSLGSVCCPISCGQCGLPGCGSDGNSRTECCVTGVLENQPLCTDSNAAPCVIVAGDGTCSNGYAGFEGVSDNGIACCPLDCGFCGGATCAEDGRRTSCCVNGVINSQPDCRDTDAAPCKITPTTETPAPATPAPTPGPVTGPTTPSPTETGSTACSNGFDGIGGINENGEACCPLDCGLCGGVGCGAGGRSMQCCINGVLNNQEECSDTNPAPCKITGAPTPSPTPGTTLAGPTFPPTPVATPAPTPAIEGTTCSNGFDGFSGINENGEACCPLDCGFCGGVGCGAGGRSMQCCINGVLNNQEECSDTNPAPCKITASPTPSPTPATSLGGPTFEPTPAPTTAIEGTTCSNGFDGFSGVNENGEACCPLDCGFCGGVACGAGGRSMQCCINGVLNNQEECSDTNPAPCKITASVTPSIVPTPSPSTISPVGSGTPAPESSPSGSLGCYKDEKSAFPAPTPDPLRIFAVRGGTSDVSMSAQFCFGVCSNVVPGFTYYGTQFGRECWCGEGTPEETYLKYNEGIALADSECGTPCTGNAAETCGGSNAMNVYAAADDR